MDKQSFKNSVLHQFHELGMVVAKAMFGGYGLYFEGVFFAIIADNRLYIKTTEETRPAYLEHGMSGFEFTPNQKNPLVYYEVPPVIFNDPSALAEWARIAINAQKGLS
jgi:DNA transformation protein